MGRKTAPMIASNVSLTEGQTQAIKDESKRKGVSFGELLRRIVDEWLDRKPGTLANRVYNPR